MNADRSPRVLLLAETLNPEMTSVPLVAWFTYRALAATTDVHLVTQVRNRDALLRQGLVEGRDFTTIDTERIARPLSRAVVRFRRGTGVTMRMALEALPYYYFERLVWRRFGTDVEAGEWDVVHRLTPIAPTQPSTIATRCARAGVPFVWGPLNGHLPWPNEHREVQRSEGEFLHPLRDLYRFMPGYRGTLRACSAILAATDATERGLPDEVRSKTVRMPANGVDPDQFAMAARATVALPLRGAFAGRLVPFKCADVVIEAAQALLRDGTLVLDVIGDGPQRPELERLADDLGCGDAVTFHGRIPHAELSERLGSADIFVFPSIHESGGAVVLEAMAMGLVPIVAGYGGPPELVGGDAGYSVPIGPKPVLVEEVRHVLEALAADPSVVADKAVVARARAVESFSWDAKAARLRAVYRWVTGGGGKPDFGADGSGR